jgi:hypothetical protein
MTWQRRSQQRFGESTATLSFFGGDFPRSFVPFVVFGLLAGDVARGAVIVVSG